MSRNRAFPHYGNTLFLCPELERGGLDVPKKAPENDIVLPGEKLRKYFPRSYSPQKIQETIFKLLDAWIRKRQHDKSR